MYGLELVILSCGKQSSEELLDKGSSNEGRSVNEIWQVCMLCCDK